MKKILFLFFSLTGFIFLYGQGTSNMDSLKVDSVMVTKVPTVSKNDITKADADSAYTKEDYILAIQLYENLLKEKGESADVYYNLGNSYYKAGDIAKAILNYERALLLKPGSSDIHFNLDMARSKTVDKINSTNKIFFVTWIKSFINIMGVNGWAKFGIASFIIFLIAILFYIFSKRMFIRKTGFIFAVTFFILTILANIFATQQKEALVNRKNAIIVSPSVTVKSTPTETGTDLFILHEGTKVEITDNSMKEWKEIKLEDGNVGWVAANVIEII